MTHTRVRKTRVGILRIAENIYTYEPVSVKTGLNDIDIKIEITTSLESIGLSIRFLKI